MSTTNPIAYACHGSSIYITDITDTINELPLGTYSLQYDQMRSQFYLSIVENFTIPEKIYGDVDARSTRMLGTYLNSPESSLGILLTGEKGSGKSLLAKYMCIKARDRGISTIIVGDPYHGPVFNRFLQSIPEHAIIFFDEFEKVYNADQQNALLTLFDGSFQTNKLFLLTTNKSWSTLADALRNRPGRIHYFLKFGGLTEDEIRGYCEDKLNDKSRVNEVVGLTAIFEKFNFDMLRALVAEMNLYNESAKEAATWINISIDTDLKYDMVLKIDGVKQDAISPFMITNPLSDEEMGEEGLLVTVPFFKEEDGKMKLDRRESYLFTVDQLVNDGEIKRLTFRQEKNDRQITLEMNLQTRKVYDYSQYAF